jgi:hypothetical protein
MSGQGARGLALGWIDAQADRILSIQRAQVDTAKLLVTFITAVSGTFVATALQVGTSPSRLDWTAVGLMAITVVLALIVVAVDRIRVADHDYLLSQGQLNGWTDDQFIKELRVEMLASVEHNASFVHAVMVFTAIESFFAIAATAIAVASMLR